MNTHDLASPDLYINRELSWLEFNERVLQQGRADAVPLMERLKFLSIVSSNLDEFFMIRVAGLKQRLAAGRQGRDAAGLTAGEQLRLIALRVHRMVDDQTAAVRDVLARLADHEIRILGPDDLSAKQNGFLDSYFDAEVLPLLTPLAVAELDPFPVLPGLALNLALLLAGDDDNEPRLAIVPVPGNLRRFVSVPTDEGVHVVPLEQVILRRIGRAFPEYGVAASAVFRLTRDADVAVVEDEADDLLQAAEEAVRSRRRRSVVRLELSAGADPRLRDWLIGWTDSGEEDVYEVAGLLDVRALMDVAGIPGFGRLRDPDWPAQPPRDLARAHDLWDALREGDALLFHPYESFEPVVSLVEAAADDPNVLAIKQTLYRTSGESPIVAALARAGENGKQVTVLVELQARFDEARNAMWCRRLEDAGCHVIYGIAGYKTHAKVLLIIRREAHGIRRYVHMSTGNYNDRTAKLYADIGFMTADRDVAADAAAFFNLLTGYSQQVGWSKLTISPTGLRQRTIELIEREIRASSVDQPGRIMAKMNSLQDAAVCRALYRAAQAGVRIRLNIRGVCCLRPGIEGVSDTIEVNSIVDRYLEHARIFYFRNGGHEEVYLSSADWMERNLDRRLETMFPILDSGLRQRVIAYLETCLADNVKAWRLQPDGRYEPAPQVGPAVRAQAVLYDDASAAAHAGDHQAVQFRPLTSPRRGPD